MKTNVRRRGFTLPEVLVTVTIVAVLAAVVVPAVLNQVDKGDDAAEGQDIIAIRTAVTTFVSDTRKFPGRLTDLGVDTLNTVGDDVDGVDYGTLGHNTYKGPYINIGSPLKVSPSGIKFRNDLIVVTNQVCMQDTVIATAAGATRAQALHLESLLEATSDSLAGVVRWSPHATQADSIVAGTLRVCLVNKG
jgi:general secretion pathway protein G